MAQLSEIDQIRRKRRRKIFFTRVFLLIALTLAGVGIFLVKDTVNAIDIGGFFSSGIASVASGPGFPVDFAGESIKSVDQAGRCLVVLTDSNLTVYNPNGRQLRDLQHKYSDPVVRVNGRHILLYDRGGKRLRVESFTGTVAERQFEYPIYAGDISKNGDVAIVTGAQYFNAELAVYNAKLSEAARFTWKSPDQFIIDVSFTQDAKGIAAAAVSAQGGDLVSKVRQYRLDQKEMAAETVFSGELLHSVKCTRGGGVVAVTDARTAVLDGSGTKVADYAYNYETLSAFAHSEGGETALMFGDYLEDKTGTLVLLDTKGEMLWSRGISTHTTLLSMDDMRLGLISDGKLTVYNNLGQETGRQNLDSTPLALSISGTQAYLITPDSIQKLSI